MHKFQLLAKLKTMLQIIPIVLHTTSQFQLCPVVEFLHTSSVLHNTREFHVSQPI